MACSLTSRAATCPGGRVNSRWIRLFWGLICGWLLWLGLQWGPLARPWLAVQALPLADERLSVSLDPHWAAAGTLLVSLDAALDRAALQPLAAHHGLVVEQFWPQLHVAVLRPAVAPDNPHAPAALRAQEERRLALAAVAGVRAAAYDGPIYAADRLGSAGRGSAADGALHLPGEPTLVPDDPRYPEQWALARIQSEAAWQISQGSRRMVVAVIDSGLDMRFDAETGFRMAHEDLDLAAVWTNLAELYGEPGVDDDGNGYVDDLHGWDWVDRDRVVNDPYGHGTHVGGVIAAATNNGVGVASMGRRLVVLPLRILDHQGSGTISSLIAALAYVVEQQVPVVNLSLVTGVESPVLRHALQAVHASGVLIVAAAGNSGSGAPYYPGAWPEAVAVAATESDDTRARYSNYGPWIELAAPGSEVLSTFRGNSYYQNSGTSMATPHVAALAGLIWSLRPELSRDQVVALMRESAEDVNREHHPGRDDYLGWGRINAYAALWQASRQVRIQRADGAGGILAPAGAVITVSLDLSVAAVAGGVGSQPVDGAAVRYHLEAEAPVAGTTFSAGLQLSDETGRATVRLSLPQAAGMYRLQAAVGQANLSVPVTAFDFLLTLDRPVMSVGEGTAAVGLEVQDGAGLPLPIWVPVELRVDRGSFSDGSRQLWRMAVDGRLSELVQVGTVAGPIRITAVIGGVERSVVLQLTPGPAILVHAHAGEAIVQPQLGVQTVEIGLEVRDRYGNGAADGTVIALSSSVGVISPTVETLHGRASARLTVPAPLPAVPVVVQARVVATGAVTQLRLPVARLLLLPLVAAQP